MGAAGLSNTLLSGLRMLVLEDEFLIAMDLEQHCRDHGAADVVICRSIAEVGDPSARFDAAIIDVMLGAQSTFDFARDLAAAGLPFVFATGYSDTPAMLKGFPDVPVIPKPYISSQVTEALEQALGRSA